MEELKSAGLLDRREGLASLPTGDDSDEDEGETGWSSNSGSKKAGKAEPGGTAEVIQLDRRAAERVATGKVGRS